MLCIHVTFTLYTLYGFDMWDCTAMKLWCSYVQSASSGCALSGGLCGWWGKRGRESTGKTTAPKQGSALGERCVQKAALAPMGCRNTAHLPLQFYFHIISISKSLLAALAFDSDKRGAEERGGKTGAISVLNPDAAMTLGGFLNFVTYATPYLCWSFD